MTNSDRAQTSLALPPRTGFVTRPVRTCPAPRSILGSSATTWGTSPSWPRACTCKVDDDERHKATERGPPYRLVLTRSAVSSPTSSSRPTQQPRRSDRRTRAILKEGVPAPAPAERCSEARRFFARARRPRGNFARDRSQARGIPATNRGFGEARQGAYRREPWGLR